MVGPTGPTPAPVPAITRPVQPGVPEPVPEEGAHARPGPVITLGGRGRVEEPPVTTAEAEILEMAAPAVAPTDAVIFMPPTRVGDAPASGTGAAAAIDGAVGDDAPLAPVNIPVLQRRSPRPCERVMRQIVRVARPTAPRVAPIPPRGTGREDAAVPVETIPVEVTSRVLPAVKAKEMGPGVGPVRRPR